MDIPYVPSSHRSEVIRVQSSSVLVPHTNGLELVDGESRASPQRVISLLPLYHRWMNDTYRVGTR